MVAKIAHIPSINDIPPGKRQGGYAWSQMTRPVQLAHMDAIIAVMASISHPILSSGLAILCVETCPVNECYLLGQKHQRYRVNQKAKRHAHGVQRNQPERPEPSMEHVLAIGQRIFTDYTIALLLAHHVIRSTGLGKGYVLNPTDQWT